MSVADDQRVTLPARAYVDRGGLRRGARQRLRALVDLRLPRARRGRARLVRDRQRRRRARRGRARRRRRAARALERLPPPRDADPVRHRALPQGAALPVPRLDLPPGRPARRRARGPRLRRPRPRGRAPADVPRRVAAPGSCSSRSTPSVPPLAEWFGDARERLESLGIARPQGRGPAASSSTRTTGRTSPTTTSRATTSRSAIPGLLRMLDYKRYDAAARPAPRLDQRAAARQALGRPPRAPLPAPRAADGRLSGRPARDRGPTRISSRALFLDLYPDQYDTWQMIPVAPDRTLTVSWVFTPEQEPFTNRIARRINWRFNDRVMDEDKTLCAGVQQGLGARTYERGVLNRNERAIAHYHDLLREMVPGIDERVTGSRRDRLDTWLFLPPELERDGPGAARPAGRPRPRRSARSPTRQLRGRGARARGDARALAGLPACARRAGASRRSRAIRRRPCAAAALRLAAMLLEQQLLAPGRAALADRPTTRSGRGSRPCCRRTASAIDDV